jgi:hypothetical protein
MTKPNPIKPGKVSKAEQRVIIAKDALAQLKAERFIAQAGVYVGAELFDDLEKRSDFNDDAQAKPLLLKKETVPCRVCAKGALFLSAVRKYNKATIDDIACDVMTVAENIFGKKQFDQIEAAFEQWEETKSNNYEDSDGIPAPKAYAFGMKYNDDTERLEAILKNIIKNKGTFKP